MGLFRVSWWPTAVLLLACGGDPADPEIGEGTDAESETDETGADPCAPELIPVGPAEAPGGYSLDDVEAIFPLSSSVFS